MRFCVCVCESSDLFILMRESCSERPSFRKIYILAELHFSMI